MAVYISTAGDCWLSRVFSRKCAPIRHLRPFGKSTITAGERAIVHGLSAPVPISTRTGSVLTSARSIAEGHLDSGVQISSTGASLHSPRVSARGQQGGRGRPTGRAGGRGDRAGGRGCGHLISKTPIAHVWNLGRVVVLRCAAGVSAFDWDACTWN